MKEEVEIKLSDNVKSPIAERSAKMTQDIFDLYFNFVNGFDYAEAIVDEVEKTCDYGEMFEESIKLTDKQKETLKKTIKINIKASFDKQKQKYKEKLFKDISGQDDLTGDNEILKVKKILKDHLEELFTDIGDKFNRGCFVNGTVEEIKVGKKLVINYYNPRAKITTADSLGVVICTTNVVKGFTDAIKDKNISGEELLKKKETIEENKEDPTNTQSDANSEECAS